MHVVAGWCKYFIFISLYQRVFRVYEIVFTIYGFNLPIRDRYAVLDTRIGTLYDTIMI